MLLPMNCPSCKGGFAVAAENQGKMVRCPKCQGVVRIPSAATPSVPVTAPAILVAAPLKPKPAPPPKPSRRGLWISVSSAAVLLVVGIPILWWSLRTKPTPRPETTAKAKEKPLVVEEAPVDPNAAIDLATVQKVKRATCMLRVKSPTGRLGEATGFFAAEKGVVLTNAHVVGMLDRDSQAPREIDVVLRSGEPDEKYVPGKLVAVDRKADLAVLRVEAADADLPEPLPVSRGDRIAELQKVYIFGFPFGQKLGKNITISESAISSIRTESDGTLKEIQVNGGMHPGNSGGPVVDSKGRVVAVAVAVIQGTQINFAVPSLFVHRLLDGRLLEKTEGDAYLDGSTIKLPIALTFADPLRRLREVKLSVWTGELGAPKSESEEAPKAKKGDSPRKEYPAEVRDGKATAAIPLPALPRNHVYWVQPVLVGATGKTVWAQVEPFELHAAPLERMSADLRHRANDDANKLTLTTASILYLVGDPEPLKTNVEAELEESGVGEGKRSVAVRRMDMKIDSLPPAFPVRKALATLTSAQSQWKVDEFGAWAHASTSLGEPPAELRKLAGNLHDRVIQALQMTAFRAPNREMQPLESWDYSFTIKNTTWEIRCTYEGRRRTKTGEEAVITVRGQLKQKNRPTETATLTGKAAFDLTRGCIADQDLRIVLDGDSITGTEKDAESLEIRLKREPQNGR